METARLEAFSDGVFAVAITLLALDLTVTGGGNLAHQLANDWPKFAAYVVSFFTIGIAWVNHHALLASVKQADRTLLFINLVLLMFVVVIPFATSTMAEYLRTGGADAHLAAALYAVLLEGMGVGFNGIFLWSIRDDRRRHMPLAPDVIRAAVIRFGFGAAAYAVAIIVAFINAPLALLVIAAVAVYYVFEQTPATAT